MKTRKSKFMRSLFHLIVVGCLICSMASAQEDAGEKSVSLAVHGGYSFLTGDWKSHPFADVDQFGGSLVMQAELEFMVGERTALAIAGGYLPLDTDAWTEYATAHGNGYRPEEFQPFSIQASASLWSIGLVLKPFLVKSETDHLKLELGASAVFPSGHEEFDQWSYDYDFLKSPSFGLIAGIEYERLVSQSIALTVKTGSLFVISGIHYADSDGQTMVLLPITAGIRFYL